MADSRIIDGLGLWFECHYRRFQASMPALFLDRDGVIVEETHYLGRPDDVRMIAGAAVAIKWANDQGLPVVLVTNQAGIGRGYYDWSGFEAVQDRIRSHLAMDGARLDLVLACAFHEKALGKFANASHSWRKPNPGMIQKAAETLAIDLSRSMIIGDKLSDLEAGRAAGIGRGALVETGHGHDELVSFDATALSPMRVATAPNVKAALDDALSAGWCAQD